MSSLAKKLVIGLCVPAALLLSGCSDTDTTNQLKTELEIRGFTNLMFVEAPDAISDFAKVNVSVGGCRLQLTWTPSESWTLVDDSDVDGMTGELTAEQIRGQQPYVECAKLPVPSTPPTPGS